MKQEMQAKTLPLTLILMRHAKSDWSEAGLSDHDRPLNARGRRDAPQMAKWIQSHLGLPELILASTATRVQETIHLLQQTWKTELPVIQSDSLYLASAQTILEHIENESIDPHGQRVKKLMVVGHNPGMELLVSSMTHHLTPFPTAAVAGFKGSLQATDDGYEWQLGETLIIGRPKEI